ncbi:hypothetical protein, conserved [Eimeria brunetti]|uniref:Exportin-2 central domain-containing protein n=1 Tax=Eimeria brunetti TaxID=51314 RepID=U6LIS3_9EIME|nr:hypothetical protein, conserved [Eimeria brunetti]
MDNWFEMLSACIRLPVPASVLANLSAEERGQLPVYKAKKWALQIVQRVFTRFGDQKMLKRERGKAEKDGDAMAKAFGEHFINNWARRLTEELLLLLQQHVRLRDQQVEQQQQQQPEEQQVWLSARMLNLTLQYLSRAVENASLYTPIIKPQGEFLVFNVCLSLMHYSKDDEETWEAEPIEFIRRQNDPLEAFSQPREAAIEFVKSLVRYRAKDFLEPMFVAVHRVCTEYEQATKAAAAAAAAAGGAAAGAAAVSADLCRAKDAALMLAGAVCDRLTSKKRQAPIEAMLSAFVLPDLHSANKFLRLRACWVYEVYLDRVTTWQDPAAVVEAYNRMLGLLGDPELPVRVQAGVSIKSFFDLQLPQLQQVIVPNLKYLAERLFALMQDIDHDQLVSTLERLVITNEEHIAPLARDLTAALTNALLAMLDREGAAQRNRDTDAEDDASFASMAVMSTLKTVLGTVTETPHIYSEILQHLLPALDVLLTPDGIDHLEDTLSILSYLTYYLPTPFPPKLWSYFTILFKAVSGCTSPLQEQQQQQQQQQQQVDGIENGWAMDHLEQMLPLLNNFIARDLQTFAAGKTEEGIPYPECIFRMAQTCIQDADEQAQQSEETVDKSTKRAFILFISSMLVYSLEPAVQLLHQKQILEQVMAFVLDNSALVEAYQQRKVFVLAFAPLLRAVSASPSQWPACLVQQMETLVPFLASHGIALRELKDKAEEGAAESELGSDNDSEQSLDDTQDAELHAKAHSLLLKLDAEWEDDDDEDWDLELDS